MYKDIANDISSNVHSNGLGQDDYKKSVESVTDDEAIKNSVRNIIATKKGTVPGKPEFGSNIYNILFELFTPLTRTIAINYVQEALQEFENRINILDIDVKFVEEYNKITIDVQYEYVNNGMLIDTTVSVALNV